MNRGKIDFAINLELCGYTKIILIIQFFIFNNEARNNEIRDVLIHNCNNPQIDEIHLLNEQIYDLPFLKHEKIHQLNIGKRMSYYDAFYYSKENLESTAIKIVANNDITYNAEDLHCLRYKTLYNKVICLTRYEFADSRYDRNRAHIPINRIERKTNRSNSQDSWIFVDIQPTMDMDVHLGKWCCDHRIAKVLHDNKYIVMNNCWNLRSYHHHFSNHRTYSQIPVDGEGMLVPVRIDVELEYIRSRLYPR